MQLSIIAATLATLAVSSPAATRDYEVGGRVLRQADGSVRVGWPGVYFNARFEGRSVGIRFDDDTNHYAIEVDGKPAGIVARPDRTTHWVRDLPQGSHTIRVVKRTELAEGSGRFLGFVAGEGGKLLPPPAASTRQIEFIGDSYTAGLGAESGKRDCSDAELVASSNADITFGALTAKRFAADYQLNGYSGLGLVRNYAGALPTVDYRDYYDRAVPAIDTAWVDPAWKPQLVVVGLGINDFSVPPKDGEAFTRETLRTAYKAAYRDLIAQLRQRYGRPYVVVSATALWPENTLREVAQEIVTEARAAGDLRVAYFYYDGLDNLGCQWHPSIRDHQAIADRLTALVDGLGIWK
ncbi:SGNH/GDSL hydrolase family protein [Chitinolyticbacter albus]|uniref:SGNH/GDSL hydrolase family protein n=1 Tax=Chitinolyticbacter albus TaxID=2961951 RepID=UPI00210B0F1D|nr:SGNH/GDSL hydrolase family protein [Chitinolyticbacter albus]